MPKDERRRGPFCAEWIQALAVVCRYCQRDVPRESDVAKTAAPREAALDVPPVQAVFVHGPVVAYPETAVLTVEQVGAALQMHPDTIWDLGLPRVKLGKRTTRFHWGEVLKYLDSVASR